MFSLIPVICTNYNPQSILNQVVFSLLSTVYVRADPDVCFERIKKRCRKEEALVPFVRYSFTLRYNACMILNGFTFYQLCTCL